MTLLQRFDGAGVWPRDIPFCSVDPPDFHPAIEATSSGQAQERKVEVNESDSA